MSGYDAAAKDPAVKSLLQGGVQQLDDLARTKFGTSYIGVSAEAGRVTLLRMIEGPPFFQKTRGDLIMTLYNNKEVWARLGYEGSSADKGGYIDRGFNDINWL